MSAYQKFRSVLYNEITEESKLRENLWNMVNKPCNEMSIKMSRKLSVRMEKFYRYAYNGDMSKVEEYYSKVQDSMNEILDVIMDGKKTYCLAHEDDGAVTTTKNEGAALTFGRFMTDFKQRADKIIKLLKIYHN